MSNADDKLREIMAKMPKGDYVHSARLLLDMIDKRDAVVHSDEERERHAGKMLDLIFQALTPKQKDEAIVMLEKYLKDHRKE